MTLQKTRKSNAFAARLKQVGVFRVIALSVIGAVGAWLAFALAVSGLTRTKNPDAALMFMPNESMALAGRGDLIFFSNLDKPPPSVRALALSALRQQAINPKALRLLGYYADTQGESEKAEKFIRAAEKLSRREAASQLWLIEAAARKNDSLQALTHYNIVLRTKPDTQAILFPRLLSAIDDRAIRNGLKPYIRSDDEWAAAFLFFANAKSSNLPALVDLMIETGGLRDRKVAKQQELGLLSRLLNEKYFAEARRLFLEMPGAKPDHLESAAFTAEDLNGDFGVMGWSIIDNPDSGAGFIGKSKIAPVSLSVFANSATTGIVANKPLYLKPGAYRFNAKLTELNRGDGGFLRWQIRCPTLENGPAIWTLDSIDRASVATIEIPANCPFQFIDIIASGGKGQNGLEAMVSSIAMTKLSASTD